MSSAPRSWPSKIVCSCYNFVNAAEPHFTPPVPAVNGAYKVTTGKQWGNLYLSFNLFAGEVDGSQVPVPYAY